MMTRTMPIDRSICSLKLLSTRDGKSAMFGEEFEQVIAIRNEISKVGFSSLRSTNARYLDFDDLLNKKNKKKVKSLR